MQLNGNGTGGDRLPARELEKEREPVRFDSKMNMTHRFREDSPVRRSGDRTPLKDGGKVDVKGGRKKSDKNQRKVPWWERKNRPRGKGKSGKVGDGRVNKNRSAKGRGQDRG